MAHDIIELEGMEFHAYHGCYDLEQIVGNRFLVDVRIEADLKNAAKTDDIDQSINYLTVYEIVAAQMTLKSRILENVAKRIIDALYAEFPESLKVSVKVSKLAPPLGGKITKVSVTSAR